MINHGVFHEGRCFHFVFLVLDLLETLVDLIHTLAGTTGR
jgi:hypothetical protein